MSTDAYGTPAPAARSTTVEVRRIDPLQAGKIFAILQAAPTILFVPLLMLGGLGGAFAGPNGAAPAGAVLVVLALMMPVLYAAIGFFFGALFAWLYNLIVGWIGGLKVDLG